MNFLHLPRRKIPPPVTHPLPTAPYHPYRGRKARISMVRLEIQVMKKDGGKENSILEDIIEEDLQEEKSGHDTVTYWVTGRDVYEVIPFAVTISGLVLFTTGVVLYFFEASKFCDRWSKMMADPLYKDNQCSAAALDAVKWSMTWEMITAAIAICIVCSAIRAIFPLDMEVPKPGQKLWGSYFKSFAICGFGVLVCITQSFLASIRPHLLDNIMHDEP